MFRKFIGFTRNSKPQLHIDSRFQYFHNYWQVAQPKDTDIFFNENRLESHRSLLVKVENQIRYNFTSSKTRVEYLLFNNELFSANNPITKGIRIQTLISQMRANYAIGGTVSIKEYNRIRILGDFNEIKEQILGKNYSVKLAKLLVKTISTNHPLSNQVKDDIRFFVNAFIVELCHKGYSFEYIAKVPDIITFSSTEYKFPFPKTIEDFGLDKAKFTVYIEEEEAKEKTLAKCLSGLVNIVNRPFQNGYFVFKVNDFYLEDPHPIKVGDVEFYNPQKQRKLYIAPIDEKVRQEFTDIEDFRSIKDRENGSASSQCNVIIPSNFIGPKRIVSDEGINYAFHKAVRSLDILNDIMNRSGRGGVGNGKISFHRHFRLHDNYRLANTSFDIFNEKGRRVDFTGDKIDKSIREELEIELQDISAIRIDTEFGSRLLHVMSVHSRFSNNQEMFNFKDLWIAWESIAPKDFTAPEDFIKKFAKAVFRFHYKKDYLIMVKGFLSIHLMRFYGKDNPNFISLSDNEMKSVGLYTAPGKFITTSKFKNNLHTIGAVVPNEIVQDSLLRANEFVANPTEFFNKLDTWVDNMVDDIYIERNMEVHKNLTNDLSKIKLRDNFLKISKWMAFMMAQFTDKRSPEDLDRIYNRILNATNKLRI